MFMETDQAIAIYQHKPAAPMPAVQLVNASETSTHPFGALRGAASFASGIARTFFASRLWLTPQAITAVLAVLFFAAALWFTWRKSPSSPPIAADLLQRAIANADAMAARPDQVLHRTINLEERRVAQASVCDGCGELIARRRIEVWQSAEKGVTARRLYDERGALVAGDWRRADGVQTLYHHGAQPKLQLAPERRGTTELSFENAWELSPSAKEFSSLIGQISS